MGLAEELTVDSAYLENIIIYKSLETNKCNIGPCLSTSSQRCVIRNVLLEEDDAVFIMMLDCKANGALYTSDRNLIHQTCMCSF